MAKTENYIFVLWGKQFQEVAAAIFITELRKAGLRVKMVGLTRRQSSGIYGLALVPDLTLEQALPLAPQAICLIVPCALAVVQPLKNNPRLHAFLDQVQSNGARIIVGQIDKQSFREVEPHLLLENVSIYPDSDNLMEFARQVAGSLTVTV